MGFGAPSTSSKMIACPECGEQNDEQEAYCSHCHTALLPFSRTRILNVIEEGVVPRQAIGESVREEHLPIKLQIDGVKLALPLHDNITVGRPLDYFTDQQIHIDLSRFAPQERGVSRRHIRLVSRNNLTYVADLNSTNGTWLNGQRLTPFNEYLLHDGDELRLGLLKIRVKF